MTYEVDCIKKPERQSHYERIEGVGGKYITGTRWYFSEADAIDRIERLHEKFIVTIDKKTVRVIVAEREDRKYLKTEQDSETENNLLSLPDCES
jgi:hypothetical protein